MTSSNASLPDDLPDCQALIESQQSVITQLEQQLDQLQGTSDQQSDTIDSLKATIEKLQHELQLLKRFIFGQRRERYVDDPRQQKLFDKGLQSVEEADLPNHPVCCRPRPRLRRMPWPCPDYLEHFAEDPSALR